MNRIDGCLFTIFSTIAQNAVKNIRSCTVKESCTKPLTEKEHFVAVENITAFANIKIEIETQTFPIETVDDTQHEIRITVADGQKVGVNNR